MHNILSSYFGEELVQIHVPGYETEIGLKKYVRTTLKMARKSTRDSEDIDDIVRRIRSEVSSKPISRDYDLSDFCFDKAVEDTSKTLLALISKLVSDGKTNKKALTLAQCIQQHIGGYQESRRNQTSLGLAIKLHHKIGSSELIRILHDHGITSSYDEVLRFRKSAASYVSQNTSEYHKLLGLTTEIGRIFGWCDNYDLWISSPNGMKTTHAMVSEFTIHPKQELDTSKTQIGVMCMKIPRLKKSEAAHLKLANKDGLEIINYNGPNKAKPPSIPEEEMSQSDLDKLNRSLAKASQRDADFFNQLNGPEAIEYSDFNAQEDRKEKNPKAPKTLFVFGPLLNFPPSHPDTVLTTMQFLLDSLKKFGMEYANICMDMQLFMVASQIKWDNLEKWKDIIIHPGMMHTMMSFLGCIGSLMKASGMETVLATTFGSIKGIMNGKSWPQALRAYRMLTAALLDNFLNDGPKTSEEIEDYLETDQQYPTRKLWINCLIKPTFIAHRFLRAEREGDLLLREKCLRDMLPYFFAAGHHHYARYITIYLYEVMKLPENARKDLMDGCNVCRHSDGAPAVSSDQFGEQTYIKQGKGSGGLKGISTNDEQVSVWINSFSICSHVSLALDDIYTSGSTESLTEGLDESSYNRVHKEEAKRRKELDSKDRKKLIEQLIQHSHPLHADSEKLFNIVNGQCASEDINVYNALKIGELQMKEFISNLPDGFHFVIEKRVKTMQQMKKSVVVQGKAIYNLESHFVHLLLIGQQRNISLQQTFQYELSAVPLSLLDEYGCLRKGDKSILVRKGLGIIEENHSDPDYIIIDGSQLLYHITWPIPGKGQITNIVDGMKERIKQFPDDADKLIIFDKYKEISAKGHERQRRAGAGSAQYNLEINTALPGRETIMKNTSNKQKLFKLLCKFEIWENTYTIEEENCNVKHEEADIIMISYMLEAAKSGKECIRVVSDDTDVFLLLVYWVWKSGMKITVQMQKWNGIVFNINETVALLGPKCQNILSVHALSGCDTVSYPYGKGKLSAFNVLKMEDLLNMEKIGNENSTQQELLAASTQFFLSLYRQKNATNLNEARYNMYKKKKNKPNLKTLPPTDLNLLEHTLRSHLQVMLWKSANKSEPPKITQDITKFGWNTKGSIMPMIAQQLIAPQMLLDVISCGCRSEGKACAQRNCKCHNDNLSCTEYCACESGSNCKNPFTTYNDDGDDDDADEDDDDDDENEFIGFE